MFICIIVVIITFTITILLGCTCIIEMYMYKVIDSFPDQQEIFFLTIVILNLYVIF